MINNHSFFALKLASGNKNYPILIKQPHPPDKATPIKRL